MQRSMNKEINYAKEYHEETKHSEISIQLSRHYLDWNNKPLSFKIYSSLSSISLPNDFPQPTEGALTCIGKTKMTRGKTITEIKELAEILFYAAGITRVFKRDYGTYYMRAASATGALYPIELYVICQDLPGLKAGVYHFCPGDFSLTEVRSGDYRANLARAVAGDNDNIMRSPITIAFTSFAWRNAWKYQSRSYRHWFWDSGVIAANLLATCSSINCSVDLILGFVDEAVNNLLRIDDKQEAAIVLAPLAGNSAMGPVPLIKEGQDSSIPKIMPLSRNEVDYPEIWKIHKASYLHTKEEVEEWVRTTATHLKQASSNKVENLQIKPLTFETSPHESSIGETILLRGSSRKFSRQPISFKQLSNLLHYSTRGVPLDILENKNRNNHNDSTVDIYFIANDVEGLDVGSYFFDRYNESLQQLKSTVSRDISGYLCLGQSLFSDASVVFFLMSDLNKILHNLGNRGYRVSQFEAGVIAGKIYLSAYAQKLGASGSTFFDDAVTEFFSPHAADKSTMIVVGVGIPGYKSRPGKALPTVLSRTEMLTR